MAKRALADGSAWEKFRMLVGRQGGDVSFIDHAEKLPQAPIVQTVKWEKAGYVRGLDARVVGETSVLMGAGRVKKEDRIDHSVGILVHKKVSDLMRPGKNCVHFACCQQGFCLGGGRRGCRRRSLCRIPPASPCHFSMTG